MANASGFNPSDKSANLSLQTLAYLGTNTSFTTTTNDSTNYAARSTWSFSSGKWIWYFHTRRLGNVGLDKFMGAGVGNGSATLTSFVGSDANAYGINAADIQFNTASLYNFGTNFAPDGGTVIAVAVNADASPKRLYFWRIGAGNSGWISATGAAADPTNSATGTDISGLGTPLYPIASGAEVSGRIVSGALNLGGWPPLTELIPIPSGYSMPDANYPFTIPSGTYTLSNNILPANTTISQNGMRYLATSGSGTSAMAYSSPFPANSLTITAVYWDCVTAKTSGAPTQGHGFNRDGIYGNSGLWYPDGSTINLGGATGPTWTTGDVTYIATNRATNRAWITADFGATWYGNGGASPDPATGTNGVDISGLTPLSSLAPAVTTQTDTRGGGTWNAGKTPDTFVVPPGFRWLDPIGVLRSRIMMA
jgi:hypothetical protein